MHVASS